MIYSNESEAQAEVMTRTQALAFLSEKQNELMWARHAVEDAISEVEEAKALLSLSICDHPDTSGHVCDHCGQYDDNPENHEHDDIFRVLMADVEDFRASGLPNLSPYNSPYSYR